MKKQAKILERIDKDYTYVPFCYERSQVMNTDQKTRQKQTSTPGHTYAVSSFLMYFSFLYKRNKTIFDRIRFNKHSITGINDESKNSDRSREDEGLY